MTLRLSRAQRCSCFLLAALVYAAALDSVRERLDAQTASFRTPGIVPPPATRLVSIADVIRRDPFAATPSPGTGSQDVPGIGGQPGLVASVPIPPGLTVPDIAAAAQAPAEAPRTYVIKATIVGNSTVAYVDDGTSLRIVRVGDSLGGRSVLLIDIRGITFTDGSRLTLPEHQDQAQSSPQSSAPRRSSGRRTTQSRAPQTTVNAEPLPSESPPTPGPLPTVKPGAFPLGTAPTSDPSAPTAFPYPYTPH
jgi:hypothetical protein